MTDRLYYDHTEMREFDAVVTAIREHGDGTAEISLDRSAFYPTSGGQPFDTGEIMSAGQSYRVTDVQVDDRGEVWHTVPSGLQAGERVHGRIDWERRFDHIQQHGGEHMLAGCIWEKLGGMTIGLHLGAENSSIDVSFPDGRTRVTPEEIRLLEETVNRRIQQNDPVRCWFPDAEELKTLPLRKAPTVSEHIRIVAFGDYEMVACGGTHPSRTGEIGCMRILSVAPVRGKARFTFVCGMRAVKLARVWADASEQAAAMLSSPVTELPEAVERLKDKQKELTDQLKHCRTALYEIALRQSAEKLPNGLLLRRAYEAEGNADAMTSAVQKLAAEPDGILLAGASGRIVFARSANVSVNMAELLRAVGKGGGKPDFASGAGDRKTLEKAAERLRDMAQ